jgi:hypothetical protein
MGDTLWQLNIAMEAMAQLLPWFTVFKHDDFPWQTVRLSEGASSYGMFSLR